MTKTRFQSTHSLRSATLIFIKGRESLRVSIHALLAECDLVVLDSIPACSGFNPRTPCGVRPDINDGIPESVRFQSTHSLRSATMMFTEIKGEEVVSIHALLAECDSSPKSASPEDRVSIHALLAECDRVSDCLSCVLQGFNPRTPCGVRHGFAVRLMRNQMFQSTHSLRSATCAPAGNHVTNPVSIHALLAECD